MVATHIEMIKQSMLCVTGVYNQQDFCTFARACESSERLLFLFSWAHESEIFPANHDCRITVCKVHPLA